MGGYRTLSGGYRTLILFFNSSNWVLGVLTYLSRNSQFKTFVRATDIDYSRCWLVEHTVIVFYYLALGMFA